MGSLTKNSTLDIDPSDPWANDALNRKAVGEYLKPIIASITQPFVISLDSPYGTGKTYFLKCLQQDFRNDGFKTVYFDAWTTDFSDDPLYAFMSAIKREFVLNGSDEQFEKNTVEKLEKKITCLTKAAGGFMRRRLGPALVRGAVEKMLGETGADKLLQSVALDSEDIADFFGEVAADALTAQEAAEESLEEFRKYLGELVKDVTAEQEEAEKQKIIIFVDELDRCRPNYAVKVLECIKHLFSVEGLVFVIAVDDTQLRNSISGVYGQNLDADGYLRRFINWRLRLPEPSPAKFAKHLFSNFRLGEAAPFDEKIWMQSAEVMNNLFGVCARYHGLSLREQEQCFVDIALVVRSIADDIPFLPAVIGPLAVVRLQLSKNCSDSGKHITPDQLSIAFRDFLHSHKVFHGYLSKEFLTSWCHICCQVGSERENFIGQIRSRGLSMDEEIRKTLLQVPSRIRDHRFDFEESLVHCVYNQFEKASQLTGR